MVVVIAVVVSPRWTKYIPYFTDKPSQQQYVSGTDIWFSLYWGYINDAFKNYFEAIFREPFANKGEFCSWKTARVPQDRKKKSIQILRITGTVHGQMTGVCPEGWGWRFELMSALKFPRTCYKPRSKNLVGGGLGCTNQLNKDRIFSTGILKRFEWYLKLKFCENFRVLGFSPVTVSCCRAYGHCDRKN